MKNIFLQDLDEHAKGADGEAVKLRESVLRQQRMDTLLESIRENTLQQIIGPFGLTPAMFEDKIGGNMTTQHNANKRIYAKEEENYNREDYNYEKAKREKIKEKAKAGELNSREFTDEYTGKKESSTREQGTDGKKVANFEVDHHIPLEELHRKGGWMQNKEKRKELASNKDNLYLTTTETNRKKSNKSAQDALSEEEGFDPKIIGSISKKAEESTKKDLPSTGDRFKYHAKDLAKTGAKDAARNALRQALGVLFYEFANGCIIEIKRIFRERNQDNLLDRILTAMKNVMERVLAKLKSTMDAALQGAVQGFFHTLIVFIINNFITTAKKAITILREGMSSLWKAIKLMANPPEGMSAMEVAREVSKIFTAVVVTTVGMLLEGALNSFLTSTPALGPLAGILSPVLMGIITGIVAALLVYGVDRLFDWLSSTGTEKLQALENQLHTYADATNHMFQSLELQFGIHQNYALIGQGYEILSDKFSSAALSQEETLRLQSSSIREGNNLKRDLYFSMQKTARNEQKILDFLAERETLEEGKS